MVVSKLIIRIGQDIVRIDSEIKELLQEKWKEHRLENEEEKEMIQAKDLFDHIKQLDSYIKDIPSSRNKEKLNYLRKEIDILNKFIIKLEHEEIAVEKEEREEISLTEALQKNVERLEKEVNKLAKQF